MADNVTITPGTGATVAADEIAGALHQRVKLSLGVDGAAADAVAGAGAVGTGVQRVTLASDDPAVAKLPAVGTAGAASVNVLTVQGIASMTPIIVSGSVASGTADTGVPGVKGGGVYVASPSAEASGDKVDLRLDPYGNNFAAVTTVVAAPVATGTQVGLSYSRSLATTFAPLGVVNYLWDGINTIPQPGNASGSVAQPYAVTASRWGYAAAASGISNTTAAVTIAASAGGSLRNYVTGIQIFASALGAATEIAIRDGAAGTVIWRGFIGTAGLPNGLSINFPVPLKGTANTLLEVVTLTASVTGSVYFNAQGYTAL